MTSTIAVLDTTTAILRTTFLVLAILLGSICLIDWMVRTRRIGPFTRIARFARGSIDPLLAPIERRVVAAGGLPSSAPIWALGVAVVAGIIVLSFLAFARNQVILATLMASRGPRGLIAYTVSWGFQLVQIALLVRVITSWVRISPYSRWVRWSYTLTEPILRPLRRWIPTIGMIDFTPILAYLILAIIKGAVVGAIAQ